MSRLVATFDVVGRSLSLEAIDLAPHWADVVAQIAAPSALSVPLMGVAFGLALRQGDTVLAEATYPPPGVTYVATNQRTLARHRLLYPPDSALRLEVWLLDSDGQHHEAVLEFGSPPLPAHDVQEDVDDG